MKITHICLNGPFTDGWNYQENMLTKYHKQLGLDVTVIASKWQWNSHGELEICERTNYRNCDDVYIVRLSVRGKKSLENRFKYFDGLYTAIENSEPDVLFIHGVSFCDVSTLARYLKNHPKVMAYADNHADFSNSAKNWLSKAILHETIWRYYAQKLVPYIKRFYGVLPARVDFLKNVYQIPANQCELLVMGADDELVEVAEKPEITINTRSRYGIRDDDFLIVTGGKIDAYKAQTLLLMEAVQKIKSQHVKLIVFGSVVQELQDRVNALADGMKVQYIGWIQSNDTYKYFAAADLVCFPGRHSVFWEQVTGQGIPMLVKDWPGTHHIDLGGNVDFLQRDSMEEIYKKLESIINDKDKYTRMKNVAMQKGMKMFSYKNISEQSIRDVLLEGSRKR